ncbi:uncharacterized protein LOC122065590 [Macadamia integrifolia]|uniref:uncharacterized protein LOC122065590 n=1 Tax=Macadamia integrifolia TaxID=60698 RepID=UPI001C4F63BE|nr:uncharacterized protein LOC122065590 [Macadamia integrifolia]
MSDDLLNKEADVKTTLLLANRRQEALWLEKPKLRWVKNGDCNSKLFHLTVKLRWARNQISTLKREYGSWAVDQRGITEYIASYFEKFHEPSSITVHHELLDCIPSVLSNEEVACLEVVPGSARRLWRGVSVRRCLFLFDALMSFLSRLVSEERGAFQKGKIISANISLASELADLMHSTVRGGGMGLKLDVQKAYDSLSWNFLFATLEKFGFSAKWISWIQLLLNSSRLSVLVNGGPVGFFLVSRGLRQGDPTSPILFILAEEVLCKG